MLCLNFIGILVAFQNKPSYNYVYKNVHNILWKLKLNVSRFTVTRHQVALHSRKFHTTIGFDEIFPTSLAFCCQLLQLKKFRERNHKMLHFYFLEKTLNLCQFRRTRAHRDETQDVRLNLDIFSSAITTFLRSLVKIKKPFICIWLVSQFNYVFLLQNMNFFRNKNQKVRSKIIITIRDPLLYHKSHILSFFS